MAVFGMLTLWPGFVAAQDLTADMRAQIAESPARFESFVAGIMLGYGSAKGLDAA